MGRRSRKRSSVSAARAGAHPRVDDPVAPRPATRRRRRGERPPAPWGSFPLVELSTLIALVMGVAGLVVGGARGTVMLVAAAALGSLAGLELATREHLAGYRSHTTLLAGCAAVATMATLFFSGVPRWILLAAAAAVFAGAFWALRGLFRRRSGGLGFR